jgi:hypothetical protein
MGRYGVFRMLTDGSALCIGAACGFTEAKTEMLDAARRTGLNLFVYDIDREQVVATSLESGPAGNAGDNLEERPHEGDRPAPNQQSVPDLDRR